MPGNSSTSFESGGIAVFIGPTSSAPMWFCDIVATVSGRSTWVPLTLPPCMIIRANSR